MNRSETGLNAKLLHEILLHFIQMRRHRIRSVDQPIRQVIQYLIREQVDTTTLFVEDVRGLTMSAEVSGDCLHAAYTDAAEYGDLGLHELSRLH